MQQRYYDPVIGRFYGILDGRNKKPHAVLSFLDLGLLNFQKLALLARFLAVAGVDFLNHMVL